MGYVIIQGIRAKVDDLRLRVEEDNRQRSLAEAELGALERDLSDPARQAAFDELVARRLAVDAQRRALEGEAEGLRAALAAAEAERSQADALKVTRKSELAAILAGVEAAREKAMEV